MSEGLGVPGCPGCERLQLRVDALEERISELEAALEESRRGGKRQAAPFSKGAPKADPKKPGRKKGEDYPDAVAFAAWLHQELGLPYGKSADVLAQAFLRADHGSERARQVDGGARARCCCAANVARPTPTEAPVLGQGV